MVCGNAAKNRIKSIYIEEVVGVFKLYGKKRKGFSIIELIIVISLMAALAGVLTPVFMTGSQAADTAKMKANLETLKKAVANYMNDFTVPFKDGVVKKENKITIAYLQEKGYLSESDVSSLKGISELAILPLEQDTTAEPPTKWVVTNGALDRKAIISGKVVHSITVTADVDSDGTAEKHYLFVINKP